jgi:hypothetical protein
MDKLAMYFFPSFTHVICAHAAKITTAKKTSASCTPFYSRSVPLLNAEDDANRVFKEQEQEQKKKKKNEQRQRRRQKIFNVSAAEASTRAETTHEKESERKKWQQRHKARQALGCCEQISKRKNTAY